MAKLTFGELAVRLQVCAAHIERARALVAAADSDTGNTYIVLTARALNPDPYWDVENGLWIKVAEYSTTLQAARGVEITQPGRARPEASGSRKVRVTRPVAGRGRRASGGST